MNKVHRKGMNKDNIIPATPTPERISTRMGRHEFNSFLYDLYGCTGKNDVVADAVYEYERYMVEVFTASPAGLMIAIHHDFGEFYGYNFNTVDVICPAVDVSPAAEVARNTEDV